MKASVKKLSASHTPQHHWALIVLLALLLCSPSQLIAGAGLSEFTIDTPGGNQIGPCLTRRLGEIPVCLFADSAEPAHELVREMHRWRYYEGHIAAETPNGLILINESTKQLLRFSSEEAFLAHLAQMPSCKALSDWMREQDAVEEYWYPITTWAYCHWLQGSRSFSLELRELLQSVKKELGEQSRQRCLDLNSPARQELQRKTTMGKMCRARNASVHARPKSPLDEVLPAFCQELLQGDFMKTPETGASATSPVTDSPRKMNAAGKAE